MLRCLECINGKFYVLCKFQQQVYTKHRCRLYALIVSFNSRHKFILIWNYIHHSRRPIEEVNFYIYQLKPSHDDFEIFYIYLLLNTNLNITCCKIDTLNDPAI